MIWNLGHLTQYCSYKDEINSFLATTRLSFALFVILHNMYGVDALAVLLDANQAMLEGYDDILEYSFVFVKFYQFACFQKLRNVHLDHIRFFFAIIMLMMFLTFILIMIFFIDSLRIFYKFIDLVGQEMREEQEVCSHNNI